MWLLCNPLKGSSICFLFQTIMCHSCKLWFAAWCELVLNAERVAPELKRNTKSEGEEEKSCVFGVSCSPLLAWFSSWIFFNFRDLERRGMKPKLRAAKSQTVCVVFLEFFLHWLRVFIGRLLLLWFHRQWAKLVSKHVSLPKLCLLCLKVNIDSNIF